MKPPDLLFVEAWANEPCPLVERAPDAAGPICAVAQQNLLAAAIRTRRPIVRECDAGRIKIVVPIPHPHRPCVENSNMMRRMS